MPSSSRHRRSVSCVDRLHQCAPRIRHTTGHQFRPCVDKVPDQPAFASSTTSSSMSKKAVAFSIAAILGLSPSQPDPEMVYVEDSMPRLKARIDDEDEAMSDGEKSFDHRLQSPGFLNLDPDVLVAIGNDGPSSAHGRPPAWTKTGDVRCRLETRNLWERFRRLGLTEMIITKAGRRMFPSVRVNFSGLTSDALYRVHLDLLPVDEQRYRYAYHRSAWIVCSSSSAEADSHSHSIVDDPCSLNTYLHPDSPFTGYQLEHRTVSFDRVKLTNSVDRSGQRNGYIVLNSMRKYRPRIRLVLVTSTDDVIQDRHVTHAPTQCFSFPECVFIAVTAYQNQLITKLKIENNPFAKGFREFSRFGRQLEDDTRKEDHHAATTIATPIEYVTQITTGQVTMTTSNNRVMSQRVAMAFEQLRLNTALSSFGWQRVTSE